MNKIFLLSYVGISFNTRDVLKEIKSLESYQDWKVQTTEQIGDRGLVLKIKNDQFDGYVLVTVDFDGKYIVRTFNKCGFRLSVNNTNNISNLVHIVKF